MPLVVYMCVCLHVNYMETYPAILLYSHLLYISFFLKLFFNNVSQLEAGLLGSAKPEAPCRRFSLGEVIQGTIETLLKL